MLREECRVPTRYFSEYMIVKTQGGYIKVDKDGNKFPLDEKKPVPKKIKKKKS